MAKKIELYEGKPVFQASNSKKLAQAVAKYEGKVEPPYVVKLSSRTEFVSTFAFSEDETVGIVLLPDSVTMILSYAFNNCKNLTMVSIPDSVTDIGNFAFSGCTKLTNVSIPDSVETIGRSAFSGCKKLCDIRINNRQLLMNARLPDRWK